MSGPSSAARTQPLQGFWERYFEVYDTLNEAPPYKRMLRRLVELLEPAAGEAILDAGSGTGNVSRLLVASGARVTGIDFCPPAIERCRIKVPQAEFLTADLTRALPFADRAFDKIACSLVLHFLPPAVQIGALQEMCRVLRPGGRVAITVFATGLNPVRVYTESLRNLWAEGGLAFAADRAARYFVSTLRVVYYQWRIKQGERAGAYQYFTADRLRGALADAGFDVLAVERTLAGQCWIAAAARPEADRPGASVTLAAPPA